MILDKFFVKLGYDYDPKKMDKFNKGVKSTLAFMKKLSIAVIGAASAFALLYSKIANKGLGQKRLGAALKTTRQELEGIKRVANELTGNRGGADRLLETFSNFGTKLDQGQISDQVQEALVRLKLNPFDLKQLSTKEIISALSKAYQEANQETKNIVDLNLGNGADEINFLKGFNEKLFDMLKPAAASFKNIEKVNNILSRSMNKFNDEILKAGNVILERLLPAFELLSKHVESIVGVGEKAANSFIDASERIGQGAAKILNPRSLSEFLSGIGDVSGFNSIIGDNKGAGNFTINMENNISTNNPQFMSTVISESIENKYRKVAEKNRLLEK